MADPRVVVVSLFAGVGGFDLAAQRVGFTVHASSEIGAFPLRVLAHRFPTVRHLGSVTGVDGRALRLELDALYPGATVLLTAGSPCQGFSIAGLGLGLEDPRSGLFGEVIRLIDELRPDWALWENVPGALSANGGTDFENVIAAFVGASEPIPLPRGAARRAGVASGPRGTVSWRVLDAQHFGVAQRRQRVFALLDTRGERSPAVLFEPEGVPRDPRAGDEAREADPGGAGVGAGGGRGRDADPGGLLPRVAGPIGSLTGGQRQDLDGMTYLPVVARTVTAREGLSQDWETTTIVPIATAHSTGQGWWNGGDVAGTLRVGGDLEDAALIALGEPLAFDERQITSPGNRSQPAPGKPSPTLNPAGLVTLAARWGVRRLMPVECERLQGFPDGWTDVPDPATGKPAADSHRYAAMGNAVCVNVARWILERLAEVIGCARTP